MNRLVPRALSVLTLAVVSQAVAAGNVAYLSSSGGYMLHNSGGTAVTADWRGQSPLEGFSGYGQIRLNGQCLGGKDGQPLRWEGCRGGDKGQVWAFSNGKLNNELGWCADVEGGRTGAGVRVLAWRCSGASNQRWKSHQVESGQSVAARIGNPSTSRTFLDTMRVARPGEVISLATGRVVSAGGANAVAAGGANVVAAGGGNVVAAGGLN